MNEHIRPRRLGDLIRNGVIHQGDRIFDSNAIAVTITAEGCNNGGHSGLYAVYGKKRKN